MAFASNFKLLYREALALVLKLVDRHDSGSCVSNDVGVRVSPRADRLKFGRLFYWRAMSSLRGLLLPLFLIVVGGLVSCERSERDYAGAARPSGSPDYSTLPSEGGVAAHTFVTSVLPQGEPVLDGAALYVANCSACHQINGNGIPGVFPPLNQSPYVVGDNLERFAAIVVYGLQGPINVNGTTYNNVMAGLGGALKDDQIAAIMNYARSAWDNSGAKGGEVTKDLVAGVRTKYGTRAMFNISELGEEK